VFLLTNRPTTGGSVGRHVNGEGWTLSWAVGSACKLNVMGSFGAARVCSMRKPGCSSPCWPSSARGGPQVGNAARRSAGSAEAGAALNPAGAALHERTVS